MRKEAGERGPYNERLTGRYNYFDPYWHPYYHGTDLHTMQSISKTVTSVIIGAAMQRGDFKAGSGYADIEILRRIQSEEWDDRKRRMTLRDLLTMTAGLDWNAEGFITGSDPQNDTSLMEASDDWVQYAIDKPMVAEPGKVWNYNDGATEVARLYLSERNRVRTSTTTARNICSHRWGSGMNGSAPIWDFWTPKAACI